MEERDAEDLRRCVTNAMALAMQKLPPEAFQPAGHGPSARRVMKDFPHSPLMKTALKAVGHKRSFTPRTLARLGGFTPEGARTLIDCLVQTGMLVCTKPPRYAWSKFSCQ